ncbi:hypothetical protein FQR65_LT11215 [Abscondita terminalis]|nr:hypothetical protein FQR65_LT11215 [Abscondita terminalis]
MKLLVVVIFACVLASAVRAQNLSPDSESCCLGEENQNCTVADSQVCDSSNGYACDSGLIYVPPPDVCCCVPLA